MDNRCRVIVDYLIEDESGNGSWELRPINKDYKIEDLFVVHEHFFDKFTGIARVKRAGYLIAEWLN